MKFDKRQIFKNVGSSWFSLGVNVITGIFLSPFILHRLGDEAFGLWILIYSVTGYYGLFDLGIRSSIIRYVAKYSATGQQEEMNLLINTALFSYAGIGTVAMIVTAIATYYVNSIFRIPAEFAGTARLLLLMVGGSVSLGFPLGVFGGILAGLQRFYLLNSINIVSTLLRTLLIIVALQRGGGLLTVALITVTLPLLNGMANALAAFPLLQLRISLRYVNRSTLRMIAGYSSATLLIIVASRLRFKTDAMVIGTFVSAAAVTYFTIGSRLMDYSQDLVSGLAQLFIPMSSESHAKGDLEGLQKILLLGNRACAFIIFPIAAVFTILGKSVIEVWVGAKYVTPSFPVLLILLYPTTLLCAQSSSGRILWGMAKHKGWAWIVLGEGICNLILSIILVRPYGIIGDAIGTAIPMIITMVFVLPGYVCRLLGISLRTYVYRSFALPLALCIPLIVTLMMMQRWFVPHRIGQLLIQASIGGLVYGLVLAWAYASGRVLHLGKVETGTKELTAMALEEQ